MTRTTEKIRLLFHRLPWLWNKIMRLAHNHKILNKNIQGRSTYVHPWFLLIKIVLAWLFFIYKVVSISEAKVTICYESSLLYCMCKKEGSVDSLMNSLTPINHAEPVVPLWKGLFRKALFKWLQQNWMNLKLIWDGMGKKSQAILSKTRLHCFNKSKDTERHCFWSSRCRYRG